MSVIGDLIIKTKQDIENKKKQREYLYEQVLIIDTEIDKIDNILKNVDSSYLPNINTINSAVSEVKKAYDDRISTGCSNNLAWVKVSDPTWGQIFPNGVEIYECKYDPDQYNFIGFYGAKYYQYPMDRDYGASLLPGITGNLQVNSNIIAITSDNIRDIKIDDTIIESNREISAISSYFPADLPQVVGFGTTTTLGITTQFYGTISSGSTIFVNTGFGNTLSISTSHYFLNNNTLSQVVGFGTTSVGITYFNDDNNTSISTSITYNTVIMKSAIFSGIGTLETTFNVGVITTVPSVLLSEISNFTSYNVSFDIIRKVNPIGIGSTSENFDENFDYTASPFSPTNIGTIDSSNLGVGHSLYFINSGDPGIKTSWNSSNKIKYNIETKTFDSTEPKVGAGRADYYVGNRRWPIKIVGEEKYYARRGDRVFIFKSIPTRGTSEVQAPPVVNSYTSSPPGTNQSIRTYSGQVLYPGNSINTQKAQDIIEAENNLQTVLSGNVEIASNGVTLSRTLRKMRKEMQLKVFSYFQASSRLKEEITELENDIKSLQDTDFSSYET